MAHAVLFDGLGDGSMDRAAKDRQGQLWRRRDVLRLVGGLVLLPACSGEEQKACADTILSAKVTPDPAGWLGQAPQPARAEALLVWLFSAPADQLLDGVVHHLNTGLGYRDLIAAMLAATSRSTSSSRVSNRPGFAPSLPGQHLAHRRCT
jgi:hypothetical protein